ncbi:uncharacterized protein LTR77_008913 [Saxophila tyrrhenica]|uniref:Protein arginine N-methyltransferase n=1 Tax=Saxophila tyrrhenica TaxID=1690608 RepID=A0AAV9NZM8_9PEZI|nr:hypothetical protein LTR77_008913 [Saxophila tyrrhenica]
MDTSTALPPDEITTIFYVGHHETDRTENVSYDVLSQAQGLGYDFLTVPITTPAFHTSVVSLVKDYKQRISQSDSRELPLPLIPPLTPQDSTLTPDDSNSLRVAVVSPWIDLGSSDPVIAHISRQVLNLEVAYAAFCGVSNVLVYAPTEEADAVGYGRAVQEALGLGPYVQLHVLLPMSGELETDYPYGEHLSELAAPPDFDADEDDSTAKDEYDVWATWDTIRSLCSYSQKLCLALEVQRQLPCLDLQCRWYSEPVRLLVFPRTTFIRNAKGYPVLSKPHQQLISRFARLRFPPWMLLSDVGTLLGAVDIPARTSPEPTPAEATSKTKEKPKDPVPHLRYLRHLQQSQPPRPPIERFGQGYQDYLQSPLQPLTDNLESVTYEVFERDPVKYEWYERAIAVALKDLRETVEDARPIVVAVAGAGRGPLVTRALQASESTGVAIDCWAVEKNPNAYVLLQRRNATDPLWSNSVHVVKSDMRHWPGPSNPNGEAGKVDILISELLGSFADNELSPECLDGVQHILHPSHGISIPQSYSAHLTPIATPRIHSDLLLRSGGGGEKWDIPYVVLLHQYDYLSLSPASSPESRTPNVQQAWSFTHPTSPQTLTHARLRAGGGAGAPGSVGGDGSNEHNSRSCRISFTCAKQGVCHGLAGYFETVLYSSARTGEKVELSTNPVTMESKSQDMISWFPIFFPLKTPVYVPKGGEMMVHMWRQTDDRSVWYEWVVEVYDTAGGKRRKVGMSEMGTSRKNACLM